MSELNNPLFENQREFLERQKEEYKHALMGDVDQIKTQGQEIGKKAAIAGGVLLAGLLVKRMISGSDKKNKKDKKNKQKSSDIDRMGYSRPITPTTFSDYDSYVHDQEDDYTLASDAMPHASYAAYEDDVNPVHENDDVTPVHEDYVSSVQKNKKSFFNSNLGKVLTTQIVTLAIVYAGKKAEEYLNSVSENNDIAEKPIVVTEIETTEFIVPEKDAL